MHSFFLLSFLPQDILASSVSRISASFQTCHVSTTYDTISTDQDARIKTAQDKPLESDQKRGTMSTVG
jgi:hypothetical protein